MVAWCLFIPTGPFKQIGPIWFNFETVHLFRVQIATLSVLIKLQYENKLRSINWHAQITPGLLCILLVITADFKN